MMTDSTYKLLTEQERMERYYLTMESALFSAEVNCTADQTPTLDNVKECGGCSFCGSKVFMNPGSCKRKALRLLMGEHFVQHDIPGAKYNYDKE